MLIDAAAPKNNETPNEEELMAVGLEPPAGISLEQ
jgi:hypothetical protein